MDVIFILFCTDQMMVSVPIMLLWLEAETLGGEKGCLVAGEGDQDGLKVREVL